MRTAVVVLGLFTLGAGAAIPAAADEKRSSDKITIERLMALAETDLNLRRAELGLIGAVLPAAPLAPPAVAASGIGWVHGVTASPAPAASPAVEAVPTTVGSQR